MIFNSIVNDIPQAHPDFVRDKQYQKPDRKKPVTVATCMMCGRKFPEREMAHVGENAFKCRDCLLNK